MWVNKVAEVLVVEPSPKSQERLVIVPVELSVKTTARGLRPLVGMPEKLAAGTIAPAPITEFVLFPPLALATTMTLLKLAALPGLKRSDRLVEAKPGRLNGVPDKIVKGPPL